MKFTVIKLYYAIVLAAFLYCFLTSFAYPVKQVENQPPQVAIDRPSGNDRFSWNTMIPYKIKVTDKEDGLSEYDEINAKEVLLEVCYLPNASVAEKYLLKKRNEREPVGLSLIRKSDCFNCHTSKDKLIGPSFDLIARKYKPDETTINRIAKNIINGSRNVWGKEIMPAHDLFKTNEVKQMVDWILKNGANPNRLFYPGIEGAFRTKAKSPRTVMVLTASYTDHGDKYAMENRKYGQCSIMLQAAN
jgi:cytochrome c